MLIAIMADTFSKNLEVKELVLMKVKLKFIIDNWWFDPLRDTKSRIKYIVAALNKEKVST